MHVSFLKVAHQLKLLRLEEGVCPNRQRQATDSTLAWPFPSTRDKNDTNNKKNIPQHRLANMQCRVPLLQLVSASLPLIFL